MNVIVFHSLLTGFTPFLPLPFIDDIARGIIMRRLYRRLLMDGDITDADNVAGLLYDKPTTFKGCLWQVITFPWFLFKKTVLWAIKKIIKLFIFVLIIDECSNLVSEAFHQGYLVSFLLRRGDITNEHTSVAQLELLRQRIDDTCDHLDPKVLRKMIKQVFLQSPEQLKRGGRLLKNSLSKLKHIVKSREMKWESSDDSKMGAFNKLSSMIVNRLSAMPAYLTSIENAYLDVIDADTTPEQVSGKND